MPENKKLFLLDAYALIYRAHFAFINRPIRNSKGVNTSAVYGFTNSLLEILEKEQPSHIAVVFDPPDKTFRHEEFEDYKAQREEMPEDIRAAIPYIYQLLEGFNIPCISYKGYEADDVIGTLAKKAETEGFRVFMMTPDKDFGQLVGGNVFQYRPSRMDKPSEVLDEKAILEKWEIENVEQVKDILGLMGDSSDNIPGVPGIGPKNATKLIKQFGSIENLLKNLDQLKGKQKQTLEENAKNALLSKKLATIIIDVPVDFEEEKLVLEPPNKDAIRSLFEELEFRALSKRILGEELKAIKPTAVVPGQGVQGSLFDSAPNAEKEEETLQFKEFDKGGCSYKLVSGIAELEKLSEFLQSSTFICFDTETAGLDPHRHDLVGISISIKPGEAWYLPFTGNRQQTCVEIQPLKPLFENESICKIGHNLKFDILVLKACGVEVKGKLVDTMLAHYLLEPEMRHNMDYLAETYLGYSPIPIESLIGKRGKGQKSMKDLAPDTIVDYACEDADITLQLKNIFIPKLKEENLENLFKNIETPLIHVLAAMEYRGVNVDEDALKAYSAQLNAEMIELEENIYSLAGMQFNLNSPRQLGEVLFDHLKLDPKAKRTSKTKQYSTDEDVLSKLAVKNPIAEKIINYRQAQKLKSTYVDAIPGLINPFTGRVHTSYNQAVTATGRLSSTNPNLQNIPIRTEQGREMRKAFVPANEGHIILAADYSQIELRLVADISKDEGMMEAFNLGIDIHTATASKVFGVSIDEVTSEMRRKSKMVNFGLIYGISAFGLAQRLNISRTEAAEIITQYFEKYPGIRKYMDDSIKQAREKGYVETLLGRRRFLHDINSANATVRGFAERNAINMPIQGTAADMIKIAMINIHYEFKKRQFKSDMILQVHDELVFDVLKEELEDVKAVVEEKMRTALNLDVPVVVEMGTGKNWLEAH